MHKLGDPPLLRDMGRKQEEHAAAKLPEARNPERICLIALHEDLGNRAIHSPERRSCKRDQDAAHQHRPCRMLAYLLLCHAAPLKCRTLLPRVRTKSIAMGTTPKQDRCQDVLADRS